MTQGQNLSPRLGGRRFYQPSHLADVCCSDGLVFVHTPQRHYRVTWLVGLICGVTFHMNALYSLNSYPFPAEINVQGIFLFFIVPFSKYLKCSDGCKTKGNSRLLNAGSTLVWKCHLCPCTNSPALVFFSGPGLFVMMMISPERRCWHHYFLKETEGPSIFVFGEHLACCITALMLPEITELWEAERKFIFHRKHRFFFFQQSRNITRGRSLLLRGLAAHRGPQWEPSQRLSWFRISESSPSPDFVINKELKYLFFIEKTKQALEAASRFCKSCVALT